MAKAKRGFWIKEERIFRADRFICSVCRAPAAKKSRTCPRCGARMVTTKTDPKWVDEMEFFDAIFDD